MASQDDEESERKPAKPTREERLQARLRENLKRRKEQARGRREETDRDRLTDGE